MQLKHKTDFDDEELTPQKELEINIQKAKERLAKKDPNGIKEGTHTLSSLDAQIIDVFF